VIYFEEIKMTNADMEKEVKDIMARVEGTINILRSSPEILSYNKLLGLHQRLAGILATLQKTDSQLPPAKA